MKKKYFGRWSNFESMLEEFKPRSEDGSYGFYGKKIDSAERKKLPSPTTDEDVLFASYGGRDYSGDAVVIFDSEDKLYEVCGSHCSCFGLEDQFEPTETTWAALALRPIDVFLSEHDDDAQAAFKVLVNFHTDPDQILTAFHGNN